MHGEKLKKVIFGRNYRVLWNILTHFFNHLISQIARTIGM